jgi:hypothetical protein
MKALLYELARLRKDRVADIWNRQHFTHLHTGQGLESPRVGQGMDAPANKKISQHGARCGIVGHFVDPELLSCRASAAFAETGRNVVRQLVLSAVPS